ncbi:MAG TPA: hypothetical protein VIH82_08840 [Acidimicrobiia bacterium]|jgi:hypothetical protein
MGRRVARVLALSALVIGLVAASGAQPASGEDEDHPVGYTFGQRSAGADGLNGIAACHFYKVDLSTGAATQRDPSGVPCGDGLTFDDDGTLYAYRNLSTAVTTVSQLITVDPHNGAQHVIGPLPSVLVGGGGMTFDAEGDLWLYAATLGDPQCTPDFSYCLYEVNPKTAHAEFVGKAPAALGVFGLAADCEDVLAITSPPPAGPVGGSRTDLDEVDTDSAALSFLVDLPGVGFPSGLDFEDDGDLWAIGSTLSKGGPTSAVYKIDPDNGNADPRLITVGGAALRGSVTGLAVDPISCDDPGPEPTPPPTPAPVVVAPTFTG